MDENRFEGFVSVHSETESEYRALSDGWTFLSLFSFPGIGKSNGSLSFSRLNIFDFSRDGFFDMGSD